MKLFFAGLETTGYIESAKSCGVENALQSFYSLGCGKRTPAVGTFPNYLLDSGGFSARQHGIDIGVKEYARYLNKYGVKFAFNLDVLDLETSLANQQYLEHNTNTYILPVYHGPEWMSPKTRDLLDYYMDTHPYIALGGMAGRENGQKNLERFLNYVFSKTRNNTMVHGLGMTSVPRLKKYPFFSVDSTSWTSVSRFAVSSVHSDKVSRVRARTRPWKERLPDEIEYWKKIEADITRLWESRGIKWGKFDYDDFMKKRKLITYKEWKEQNAK